MIDNKYTPWDNPKEDSENGAFSERWTHSEIILKLPNKLAIFNEFLSQT
jgi:hypothetical protein